jgi:hypothetical protein
MMMTSARAIRYENTGRVVSAVMKMILVRALRALPCNVIWQMGMWWDWVKVKVITTPWRRMGERMYRFHVFMTPALVGGWSASRPCRFTPRERAPGTLWLGGWVGPRTVWTTWREKSRFYRDPNSVPSAVQPVASCYADCAIPVFWWIVERLTRKGNLKILMRSRSWHQDKSPCKYCTAEDDSKGTTTLEERFR